PGGRPAYSGSREGAVAVAPGRRRARDGQRLQAVGATAASRHWKLVAGKSRRNRRREAFAVGVTAGFASVRADRVAPDRAGEDRAADRGSVQVGLGQVGTGEVGTDQVGLREV